MQVDMQSVAQRLEADLNLPQGYMVIVDARTDQIVIKNTKHGFVITRYCVRDWTYDRILTDAGIALSDLTEGKETSIVCRLYTVGELEAHACSEATFDA
jgi:hypothetical protein